MFDRLSRMGFIITINHLDQSKVVRLIEQSGLLAKLHFDQLKTVQFIYLSRFQKRVLCKYKRTKHTFVEILIYPKFFSYK